MKKKLTEKQYKEMIYEKAEKVKTKAELNKFLTEVTNYEHDYGTIVYGCMAAMKAAFNFVNRSPNGGITGFQAGCLGWECVKEFMHIKGPARLIDYENMLFPQYSYKFAKTITSETWEHLQKEAKAKLKEKLIAHENVKAHWQSIANGKIPFGYSISETN